MPAKATKYGVEHAPLPQEGQKPETLPLIDEAAVDEGMVRAYARYYASGYYDQRYPRPNARSLGAILSQMRDAGSVLDFGCGDGRYTIPLLRMTKAEIFAYDICPRALADLERRLGSERQRSRVTTVLGPTNPMTANRSVDAAIMMFGVLGHIPGRARRIEVLRSIHTTLAPGGRFVVSVPNALRRFRAEQRYHNKLIAAGTPQAPALESGDVVYGRTHNGEHIELFYHLYTVETLLAELADAGFGRIEVMAESILPETVVTRSQVGRAIDDMLHPVVPAALGYGILAVAEK